MRAVGLRFNLLVTSKTVIGDPIELHSDRFRRRSSDDGRGRESVKWCDD